MNRIDFSNPGGFPLDTDTLDFLQKSYTDPIKELAKLGGNNYIISGVEDDGAKTTDGWVVIDGDIMPFKGDPKQSTVVIVNTSEPVDFENESEREVYFTRYATFGVSLESIPFASLARMSDLQMQKKRADDLRAEHEAHKEHVVKRTGELQAAHDAHKEHVTKRTDELQAAHQAHKVEVIKKTAELQTAHEALKSHVSDKTSDLKTAHESLQYRVAKLEKGQFIRGMIMAWSGSIYSIPYGWRLCSYLADKFILGAGGTCSIGDTGGKKEHTLTVDEMPAHYHRQGSEDEDCNFGGGKPTGIRHFGAQGYNGFTTNYYDYVHTSTVGGNKPHPNMPPYYALAYIEYVGF